MVFLCISKSQGLILEADHDVIAAKYIAPMAIYLVQYFNILVKNTLCVYVVVII